MLYTGLMSSTLYLVKPDYDLFAIPGALSDIRETQLKEASRVFLREIVERYDEDWVSSGKDAEPFSSYLKQVRENGVWSELLEDSLLLKARIVLRKDRDGNVIVKLFGFAKETEKLLSSAPFIERELNVLEITQQEKQWMSDKEDNFPRSLQIILFNWGNTLQSLSDSSLEEAIGTAGVDVGTRLTRWFATQYSAFLREEGIAGVSGYSPAYNIMVDNRNVLPLSDVYGEKIDEIRTFLMNQKSSIEVSFT